MEVKLLSKKKFCFIHTYIDVRINNFTKNLGGFQNLGGLALKNLGGFQNLGGFTLKNLGGFQNLGGFTPIIYLKNL